MLSDDKASDVVKGKKCVQLYIQNNLLKQIYVNILITIAWIVSIILLGQQIYDNNNCIYK